MAGPLKKGTLEEATSMVKKTDKENPNASDVAKLREFLDRSSSLVEINSLGQQAIGRVIKNCASESVMLKELLDKKVETDRRSMEYEAANVFVKMLIDQVILNSLRLNQLELLHINKLHGRHTTEEGLYWDKRLSSAQRRFLKACESLAKVKKLLAEADLKDQLANQKRSQSTFNSARTYKALSD